MRKVIAVEKVSKYYRLGSIGGRTVTEDLKRWWAGVRGWSNPLLKVGETDSKNGNPEHIWALRDVNLEVQEGEVLGIIGPNGAGKSTLLKILSRVTTPTSGIVKIKGRLASLLEVGTGFHADLSGRDNIYLNGAINGMSRNEIDRKLEEIIDFSGVEKYIDTPVKRYSSGMYVRLAFAVAAHLEPEILIVDEVLAVGDAQFQKKCLGKMSDVASGGRTVLFVSHNMGAIQQLCRRTVLLHEGVVSMDGPTEKVVSKYLSMGIEREGERVWTNMDRAPGDDVARLRAVRVLDRDNNVCTEFDVRDPITIEMEYWVLRDLNYLDLSFYLSNERGERVFVSMDTSHDTPSKGRSYLAGFYKSRCHIPPDLMNEGQYYVQANLTEETVVHTICRDAMIFNVIDRMDNQGARGNYHAGEWPPSAVRPKLEWSSVYTPLHKETFPLPDPAVDSISEG